MDIMEIPGHFSNGAGHASNVFQTSERKEMLRKAFGYGDYLGTFNMKVDAKKAMTIRGDLSATIVREDNGVIWWFYMCDLCKGDKSVSVVLLIWEGPDKNPGGTVLELMSRERVPKAFRSGDLILKIYGKWKKPQINTWVKDQYWFQTFPWSIKRSDSALVWDTIKDKVDWHGKRVLDIGGHTGFFSFEAAKKGAIVTLFEPDGDPLERAQTIGHHIEYHDIDYTKVDPGGNYDTIMYLSVHHQPDLTYKNLAEKLVELKSRCKNLLLELIVPSLEGSMSSDEINKIVGVDHLHEYKHKVRRTRRIYHLKGDL